MSSLAIEKNQKEKDYYTLMVIVGIIYWMIILLATFGIILIFIIFGYLFFLMAGNYFKAYVYGEAVKVTEKQFPGIYAIARDQSARLGLSVVPDIFIINGNGITNAFAVRFLSRKYVILYSQLVDLALAAGKSKELSMIIGHELAHHAAGHTSTLRNFFIWPAYLFPFLGTAYSRACELTADRIGYMLIDDKDSARRALAALSLGSEYLVKDLDLEAFAEQEKDIPPFMGFIHLILSTHPRMTMRVMEIEKI
jgi:Zn-dependent protease with chaperone function